MDSVNAEKTVVLTNEAQPPPFLATDSGLKLTILQRNVGQKRFGCILTAAGTQLQHIDLEYHLQQVLIFLRKPVVFFWKKNPTYVVDGPSDEYQIDATTANVEPTDEQVKRQHNWGNSIDFFFLHVI